jgi:hypothetical protein
MDEPGGGKAYQKVFASSENKKKRTAAHDRLLAQCFGMGAIKRPDTRTDLWRSWYGGTYSANDNDTTDRCRILFAINTVGAGRGTIMLWETSPPLLHAELPSPWTSEQETAVTHISRNLQEVNELCETGLFAAKVQILVCEPIPALWTEWMDSLLPACGGKPFDPQRNADNEVEDRPSPLQVVVTASAATADSCHDLKSGFMEKRAQDLLLAPPYLAAGNKQSSPPSDFTIKTTDPKLFSSDDHDLYVAVKWSSLVTVRSVSSFLQASADLAAAATTKQPLENGPSSPFLIPSFVRVSYVSEENSKVAKWRMHGDFFHPAAWEICNDSFEMTWIPSSLSSSQGSLQSMCNSATASSATPKNRNRQLAETEPCGQWWIYFTELQMPTSPDVYANEATPPVVDGGNNFVWMITDRQRREIVKGLECRRRAAAVGDKTAANAASASCPASPQAVIPLGDMESFLINFTPNTALGRKHVENRRPGYSNAEEREKDRERVKERGQLNDQEDIEKALFDYTIYPAALFRKDATLKASASRKSSYYDVTITKPRPPVLGWCQAIARNGLCTLYADYFRAGEDRPCHEACGFSKTWSPPVSLEVE